jgi:hypothetical protein
LHAVLFPSLARFFQKLSLSITKKPT